MIIGCRNLKKAKAVAQEIFEETKELVVVRHLDMSSLKSVRQFCDDVLNTEQRLDVLINNAGAIGHSKKVKLTEDGHEEIFQTNHLAPFLLTVLLVDLLKKSSPSRVVNVVSDYHRLGNVDRLEDKARGINLISNPIAIYGNAKLAFSLSTIALAKRLKDAGVTANFLHPGAVKTSIADEGPGLRKFFFQLATEHQRQDALARSTDLNTARRRSRSRGYNGRILQELRPSGIKVSQPVPFGSSARRPSLRIVAKNPPL